MTFDQEVYNITLEKINQFIEGHNPETRIVNWECSYMDEQVTYWKRNNFNKRQEFKEDFLPFCWATRQGALNLFNGDKIKIKSKMAEHGIDCQGLNVYNAQGETTERMENGYRVLFRARRKMSFNDFSKFFKEGGIPSLYEDRDNFIILSPVEQYMVSSGKRQFKGLEEYDDLVRCTWDIETTGLDPNICNITQIGISTNHGFNIILHTSELGEAKTIENFIKIIGELDPDIITGHNSENFDWNFIMVRYDILGRDFEKMTKHFLGVPIYKKKRQSVLKLGGEIEYFNQTVWYGHTVVDSLHAVRRAQAIDSNMKSGSLKYAAEYAKLKKDNRVYVPGDKISTIYLDTINKYYFNDINGEWGVINNELEQYKILEDGTVYDEENNIKFETVTGKYIVDRYLMDDLWEGDKVERQYNMSNFFLSKMLPIPYQKAITMGTAGLWKSLLVAYSYENKLAIPLTSSNKSFTGGLSRLIRTGYVKDVVKLDYNSLYPAITLSWNIFPTLDITGIFKSLLEHVLSERERYKSLMKKTKKEGNNEEAAKYDKLQLPFKIFGNSFFGSYGCPAIFNWGDIKSAENITVVGRQSLRLMVKWFEERGFKAIVMDTDGVNFSYVDVDLSYKYISKGLNRNTVEGKEYEGIEAYVAEFSDLFLRGKMGLGIDEFCESTLNIGRKNYADLLEGGKIKYVGNSIKSKKMPKYIEKFIDNNMPHLLYDDGQTFLTNYYNYIEKIYNYQIPLRDIASIGSVKMSIRDYLKDKEKLTKAGATKARQAWMELAIRDKLRVNQGDKIYYINTGTKKGDGDVKKTPIYKLDEDGNYVYTNRIDKHGNIVYNKKGDKPLKDKVVERYEMVLNCIRIDNDIIDANIDYYGTEENFKNPIIYNVKKYIEQFNSRLKGLLVAFHPNIRDKILITNPLHRNYFTKEESKLVSGIPLKEVDQDDLYTLINVPDDKEIKFWLTVNQKPVYCDELKWDWNTIIKDYYERMEILKQEGIRDEVDLFNKIVEGASKKDIEEFLNGETMDKSDLMGKINQFASMDINGDFISVKYDIKIGSINDVTEFEFLKNNIEKDDKEHALYN